MIQLIAFLGNPGQEYAGTRHNAPWQFEESLPFASRIGWQEKFKSEYAALDYTEVMRWCADGGLLPLRPDGSLPVPSDAPKKLYLQKPLTYMNSSGEAIGEASRFFKVPPEDILVVHDEIELPLGTVSLKWAGGLGGHNGLRSAKACLGTADFWRLRFGVGKPSDRAVYDHVLGAFSSDERIVLSQVFAQTAPLLASVLAAKDAHRLIPEWGKRKLVEA